MKNLAKTLFTILCFTALAGGPAFAKQPQSSGNNGTHKSSQDNAAYTPVIDERENSSRYFDLERTTIIRNYYSTTQKSGHCPPGLAKKNNGCQPPGQLKKWRKGETLPADIIYYDLPGALLRELGRTPEGEKIIQVGTDLLLISIATGIILDVIGIQD